MKSRKTTGKRYFFIDFDSTFVKGETIDELARIVLQTSPKREAIISQIAEITKQGMEGRIPFSQSLSERLKLFHATKEHVNALILHLQATITDSFARNKDFFKKNSAHIYIISGGFKEVIEPVVKEFGISSDHVLANSLRFNGKEEIVGIDTKHLLAQNGGKAKAISQLKLTGEIVVLGDGITDYEIKQQGVAHAFFAFTENVARPAVIEKADQAVSTFDEFLYAHGLPASVSFPKSRLNVLLLENIHPRAAAHFQKQGYKVEIITRALSEKELAEKIRDVSILGIRSTTRVTEKILKNADRLLAIGAFCIGTNQIDLKAAARRGVVVFNAPYGNGRSVAELVTGEIIMLCRRIPVKQQEMNAGVWDKSSVGAREIRGKTLGIIGYGNIGSQLSVIAEGIGMKVLFYDLVERPAIGNALRCESLGDLLRGSDFVTLHIDGRSANRGFFGQAEFEQMKAGAFFLNISRGSVVDMPALLKALKIGRISGAAIDVFPEEPEKSPSKFRHPLQSMPNVILTPHIGGSTTEAQENIASYLSSKLASFVDTGTTMLSVNVPQLQLPVLKDAHRLIHIHKNLSGVLAKINTLLSKNKINILGQYLGTTTEVGYVITDVNKKYKPEVIKKLRKMPETIKLRTLY